MTSCDWDVIEQFLSPGEYQRFCVWIKRQIDEGEVEVVPVEDSYAGTGFDEAWYKCKDSGVVWRLVAPEAPFLGYWGPVL